MIAPMQKLRTAARRLLDHKRGTVMVEMAFAIPFLVLVGFAGLEIANLTLTNTRISQVGLSVADNASRIAFGSAVSQPRIRERDINDVFSGAEEQSKGLDLLNNGRVILSSLERNEDGGQWIRWQRCYGKLVAPSSFGNAGDGATGTGFAGMGPAGQEVTAPPGTAVMFVEIVYQYQPLLYGKWLGPRTIRSRAAYNVREARDLTKIYNDEVAPVASCA